MDPVEEIRARISIYDLVSQYVSLKKTGKNFKACCPFHQEKTPSFIVSPDKGLAYCFGCHQGGDIFTFVQLVERVNFKEAVKILAEKAGVEVATMSHKDMAEKKKLKNIFDTVTKYYRENLGKHGKTKKYLQNRGVSEETQRIFQLGYSPDSFEETHLYLLKKGFTRKEVIDAGLAVAKNLTNLDMYDRFRGRLMFPITNVQGQIIAFGGRSLKGGDEAKYLNSPESAVYNKSYVLYGLSEAKEHIRKEDVVIVVEGYMDLLASHQAGVRNVVASSGTALTKDHVIVLKRYTKNILFAFDSDAAGKNAAERAIDIALEAEIDIKIILLKDFKDPDECIQKDPEIWKQAIKTSLPIMRFYFNESFERNNSEEIQGKKSICNFLLPKIKKIPNLVEQNFYLKLLADEIKTDSKILLSEMKQKKYANLSEISGEESLPKASYSREECLLGMVLEHPEFFNVLEQELIVNIFSDAKTERFYKMIKNIYNKSGSFVTADFVEGLSQEERELVNVLWLFVEERYRSFSEKAWKNEIQKLIHEINRRNFEIRKKDFMGTMRKKQKEGNKEEVMEMVSKYNDFLKVYKLYIGN